MDAKMAPDRLTTVCMSLILKCCQDHNKLAVAQAVLGDDTASEIAHVTHCTL